MVEVKEQKSYVIIEQDGHGGGLITHLDNLDEYESCGDGSYIFLNEEDFLNMCQAGVGGG